MQSYPDNDGGLFAVGVVVPSFSVPLSAPVPFVPAPVAAASFRRGRLDGHVEADRSRHFLSPSLSACFDSPPTGGVYSRELYFS